MNDIVAGHVRRMKSGDEAAFDWLYNTYVDKLYRMAFLITGNKGDSEDIVQETFVKCFLRKQSIRDEMAFEAWLYQILVRTAWRYQKQKKQDISLDELTEEPAGNGGAQWAQKDESAVQPLEEVLKEEQSRLLWEAVQRLEIRQRTVVILYYFNELSVEDIARVTGAFTGTVKSRLFQARMNLRKLLEKQRTENVVLERREILG